MHAPNLLLPTFTLLADDVDWPNTLGDDDLAVFEAIAGELVARARTLAYRARRADEDPDARPPLPADLLLTRWAGHAGVHADRITTVAGIRRLGRVEDTLFTALTAALMPHVAAGDRAVAGSGRDTDVFDHALTSASWVAASAVDDDVTFDVAAHVFITLLPPQWRWERRPGTDADRDTPTTTFAVTRALPGPSSFERVTVVDRADKPVRVEHERVGRRTRAAELTWFELCQYIAHTVSESRKR